MKRDVDGQNIACAEGLYRTLLFVYPPGFRKDYGQQMVQNFRDCYRVALQQGQKRDLIQLWRLVLYDLTRSAFSENVQSLITFLRKITGLERNTLMSGLLSLDVAARTDIGRKRAANEDTLVSIVPEEAQVMERKGALFVVADGMGGHSYGDVASTMAVQIIRETYYKNSSDDVVESLRQAVEQANVAIHRRGQEQAKGNDEKFMGSTCVAVVLKKDTVYVANVGDSFAYIVRKDTIRQIAQDHSWVAEQVRLGTMMLEEAQAQGKGNVIMRSLGTQPDVEVYTASEQVQNGDVLVLCTDGLHRLVSEEEIRTIVRQYGSEESATRLIARANENGGPDNITVLVVRIALPGKN